MSAKLEAQLRGLGCGFLPHPMVAPHLATGRLIQKDVAGSPRTIRLHYAWRQGESQPGLALSWWIKQLGSDKTRQALLSSHGDLLQ